MNRRSFLKLTGCALFAAPLPAAVPAALPAAGAAAKHAPNIVFVLADDMSPYEFGCYGQKLIRTPTVDRLAADGLRATAAYAPAPLCAPSRCGILTGLHMGHAQIRGNRKYGPEGTEGQFPLRPGTDTVARRLQSAGYATGCFGKWGLGAPGTDGRPLKQGFDRFYGYNCQGKAHNYYPARLWDNDRTVSLGSSADGKHGTVYAPEHIRNQALAFIRANAGRPLFLFYASTLPHLPIVPPDADRRAYESLADGTKKERRLRAGYAAMVTRLDSDLARIIETLKAVGEYGNTLIVFSADNGASAKIPAVTDRFRSAGPLRGAKGSLYEGGIREPFVAAWPGRIAPGTVTDLPLSLLDLFPTFCDVAGLPLPPTADGRSLKPLFLGRAPGFGPDRPLYWEFAGKQSLRRGPMKWIHTVKTGTTELYNLTDDPGETRDLAPAQPRLVAEGLRLLRAEHSPNPHFPLLKDRPRRSPKHG